MGCFSKFCSFGPELKNEKGLVWSFSEQHGLVGNRVCYPSDPISEKRGTGATLATNEARRRHRQVTAWRREVTAWRHSAATTTTLPVAFSPVTTALSSQMHLRCLVLECCRSPLYLRCLVVSFAFPKRICAASSLAAAAPVAARLSWVDPPAAIMAAPVSARSPRTDPPLSSSPHSSYLEMSGAMELLFFSSAKLLPAKVWGALPAASN